MTNQTYTPTNIPNLLRKLVAVVATTAMIGLALMFSVVVFAVILVAGAIAWAYLLWKTRDLRKQMRSYPPRGAVMEDDVAVGEVIRGDVIEGEVTRVVDALDGNKR